MNRSARPQLVPSVMADSVEKLRRDAASVVGLSNLINYDVADGEFVQTRTPKPSEYPKLPEGKQLFWHLMVHDPLEYLEGCMEFPTSMIALHAEARGVGEALTRLGELEMMAGITLKPATRVAEVAHLFPYVQFVQIMTIEPGAQGRPFQPELLPKVNQVRSINPDLRVVTDGGANSGTIEVIARYQPDYIVVGSALTRSDDAPDAWRTLNRLIEISTGGTDRDHSTTRSQGL